jgi:hypothetical protein
MVPPAMTEGRLDRIGVTDRGLPLSVPSVQFGRTLFIGATAESFNR